MEMNYTGMELKNAQAWNSGYTGIRFRGDTDRHAACR